MLPLEQLHIACTVVNKAMVAGALVDRFLTLTACMVLARADDVAHCRAHNGPGANQVVPTLTVVASTASPAYSWKT